MGEEEVSEKERGRGMGASSFVDGCGLLGC